MAAWPESRPAAAAARWGASVPEALRQLGTLPGAETVSRLAAVWQLCAGSGASLAIGVGHVLETARAEQATRHVVAAELASARATARMLGVMPVMVLVAGRGALAGDEDHDRPERAPPWPGRRPLADHDVPGGSARGCLVSPDREAGPGSSPQFHGGVSRETVSAPGNAPSCRNASGTLAPHPALPAPPVVTPARPPRAPADPLAAHRGAPPRARPPPAREPSPPAPTAARDPEFEAQHRAVPPARRDAAARPVRCRPARSDLHVEPPPAPTVPRPWSLTIRPLLAAEGSGAAAAERGDGVVSARHAGRRAGRRPRRCGRDRRRGGKADSAAATGLPASPGPGTTRPPRAAPPTGPPRAGRSTAAAENRTAGTGMHPAVGVLEKRTAISPRQRPDRSRPGRARQVGLLHVRGCGGRPQARARPSTRAGTSTAELLGSRPLRARVQGREQVDHLRPRRSTTGRSGRIRSACGVRGDRGRRPEHSPAAPPGPRGGGRAGAPGCPRPAPGARPRAPLPGR